MPVVPDDGGVDRKRRYLYYPQHAIAAEVRAMRTARDFDRLADAGKLLHPGVEVLDALIEVYRRENRKKPVRYSALSAAGVLVSLACSELFKPATGVKDAAPLCALLVLLCSGLALWLASSGLHRRIGRVLLACNDIRVVGALVEALSIEDAGTRDAIAQALVPLLDRLNPKNGSYLTRPQRTALVRAMGQVSPQLAEAAIRAFVRMGDPSCYQKVASLAAGRGLARRNAALRRAASDALPKLKRLRAKQRVAGTLLRPANAPDGDGLLRPAPPNRAEDPSVLLRPIEPEAGEQAQSAEAGP